MDQDIKTVIQYPVGATEFDIPFDYLSRKFVRVSLVSDDNRRLLSNITEYRYVSKTRVKLLVETTGFDRVEIRRFTSASERIVDFSDGSVLRAADLNVSQIQSAHIAEEARDAALMAMPEDDAGNLDARNRKIVRLAPGESGTDAINKNQLDETLGEAGGILSDFEDVRDEIIQYISKFTDDTGAVRGVSYVYNNGRALGGETGFHIDITPPPLGVPYLSINGSKQYRGYHFTYDPITGNVQGLATPLEKDDFVVATTTESVSPIEDLYASPQGASMIGTLSGSTVEERIAEVEQRVIDSIDGVRVDSFIGMTDSGAIDAAITEALRVNSYVNAGGSNSIAVRGTLGIAGASGLGTLVTGTVPDDNELTIIAEPYKGKRLGLNLILTGDKGLTCRDVNSTGQISGVNALLTGKVMLTGLSSDIPTTPGTVYVDSNGNLKVKL